MEFRQLKTFIVTARHLSITKAANELGYAQSSVSGHIQMLEEELATMLFERLGRRIKLTKDGEHLRVYAEQILKLSDEAKDGVASAVTPKGALTIGTPESLCVHRLPELFQEFRERYPKVEINFLLSSSHDLRIQLRKNTIDLAFFLARPYTDSDLISQVLFEEPMAVVAAPSHPLAKKNRIFPKDITSQNLILTETGCSYRQLFESLLTQAGVEPASIMEIKSNEVIKKFVANGWGIGFLPHIVVRQEIAQNVLTALPWAGPPFAIQAQLVHHRDKWISPALRAFLDLAIARLKTVDLWC